MRNVWDMNSVHKLVVYSDYYNDHVSKHIDEYEDFFWWMRCKVKGKLLNGYLEK